MDRIVHPTAVDIGGGRRGFRSKDTVAGVSGTVVTATHLNAEQEEILAAIEATGQAPDGGDLKQLARSIQSGAMNYAVAGGTANAWTVDLSLAILSYAAGRVLWIVCPATNTSKTVNANVSILGNRRIKKADGLDPEIGDLVLGRAYPTIDDGANIRVTSPLASDIVSAANGNKTVLVYGAGTTSVIFPPGITKVKAYGRGGAGGGGGATGSSFGAGGGSGGSFFLGNYTVVPGTSYPIIVGSGGAGGSAAGSNGSNGGLTSFGSLASAPGGLGGPVANSGSSAGGASPANATGGQINWRGVAGGNGLAPGGSGQGGTGGGSYGQAAANINPISSGTGIAGTLPGVGGNGGGGAGFAGGNGGDGELVLEY